MAKTLFPVVTEQSARLTFYQESYFDLRFDGRVRIFFVFRSYTISRTLSSSAVVAIFIRSGSPRAKASAKVQRLFSLRFGRHGRLERINHCFDDYQSFQTQRFLEDVRCSFIASLMVASVKRSALPQ
jgi:hypothetical protein